MVNELEKSPRPLVQLALCRDPEQVPMWGTKLNYSENGMADRLLAYGVVISEKGPYICGELVLSSRTL